MPPSSDISIIIAVRNGAATLDAVLGRLAAQDLSSWEAIVVDDGSTDGTAAIVEAAARREPRIRRLQRPGQGVSAARNAGIEEAGAAWMMFLDADDLLEPRHLSALWAAAGRWARADVLVLDWGVVQQDGREGPVQRVDLDPSPVEALAARCPFPIHSALVRAAAARAAGGFDPSLRVCEDWDLWQRIAAGGAAFRRANGAVARYTLTPGSASTRFGDLLDSGAALIGRGHGAAGVAGDAEARARQAEMLLAAWVAGQVLGSGGDAAALLEAHPVRAPDHPDAGLLADALLGGMERGAGVVDPDWPGLWSSRRPAAEAALQVIGRAGRRACVAGAALIEAERRLARRMPPGSSALIGATAVRTYELDDPVDARSSGGERVVGAVTRGGRLVGRFEAFAADLAEPEDLQAVLADFAGAEPAEPSAPGGLEALEAAGFAEAEYWEGVFARPDPWGYESPYEAAKYEQTLAAIPGHAARALELACAEGTFTRRLLARADHVLATDISPTAVERARARFRDTDGVEVEVLDFLRDPLPGGLDLIVCSEVLYYVEEEGRLRALAGRIAEALVPGGHLVMTHANLLADDPGDTGFDWPHPHGARRIAEVFAAQPDLCHVASHRAAMYRVELFRKGERLPGRMPEVRPVEHAAIPPEVAEHLRWAGTLPAAARSPEGVPVLMYHRVCDEPAAALARYATAPGAFRAQMEWLRAHGFTALAMAEFDAMAWDGAALPERPVLITFDDGYRDNLLHAAPVLAELGLTATVFVPTGHVGGRAEWDAAFGPPAPLMGWDELARMAAQGIDLAAHTSSHRPLAALSRDEVEAEITQPPRLLAERLGTMAAAMAYPYGSTDEAVQRSLLRSGCRLAFTTDHGRWTRAERVMAIPRLEVPGGLGLDGFARLLEG